MYADGGLDEEGLEILLLNLDAAGEPIPAGRWDPDTMVVREFADERFTVETELVSDKGSLVRQMNMVRDDDGKWKLGRILRGRRAGAGITDARADDPCGDWRNAW